MKFLGLLLILISLTAQAETMDMETTTLVINKLDRLLETLDTDNSSRIPMVLRLADVHSDRARLLEMEEKEADAKKDRLESIKLLNSVFKNLDKEAKSKTLSQLAHLYQLTEQPKKAEELFKKIIAYPKDHSQDTLARAYLGMAEIEFHKSNYKKAQKLYESALDNKDTRKNLIITRLAWCHYHLGSAKKAIDTIYGPLARGDFDSDTALKEDAARDYGTFLALGHVSEKEIKTLAAVSPDNARKNILVGFASELDRLGKKKSALAVWNFIGTENKAQGDLEEMFNIVQIQYDLGHKQSTVEALKQLLEAWKSNGCDSEKDNCELLQARVKKLITDWGASEERTPTKYLVNSYALYVNQFPDRELSYWGAQAAHKLKMWGEAVSLYRKAADLAQAEGATKMFEGATLGEIDVAELSGNHQWRDNAYDHYLDVNPKGSKALEVRYQKAHIQYEKKNFKDAAQAFHDIAMTESSQTSLREKAADISIESLIAARDEDRIENWANEYATQFASRRADFQKTARDAVLNKQARVINDGDASKSELNESLEKLKAVNVASAPASEKIIHYRNRLVVAEKLQNYPEVTAAADGMMAVGHLSPKDQELALSRKQWAAEMTGNHAVAFALAKKLKMSELHEDERQIKLASLAEKAGQNPNPYYERYLRVTRNEKGAQGVMATLIRQSASGQASLRTFKRFERRLSHNPELKATLALEVFAKTNDEKFIRHQLKSPSIRRTSAGVIMSRFVFLTDFQGFLAKNRPSGLNTKTPQLLKRSLNDRLYLITKTENQAKRAIKTGDWILQIITLDVVKKHFESLAYNINALPVPRGLNKKQKQTYKQLLAQKAQPYASKAHTIDQKIYDLSKNADSLVDDLRTTAEPLKRLVVRQAQMVMKALPEERGMKLKRELSQAVAIKLIGSEK